MFSEAEKQIARQTYEDWFMTDSVELVTVTHSQHPVTGDPVESVLSAGSVKAEVQAMSSSERARQGFERHVQAYEVSLPYGTPVTIKSRLIWRGRTLEVISILSAETIDVIVDLVCSEVVR